MSINAALANFGGAGEFYLHIPGVFGDSTSDHNVNDIDVTTFTWGLVNNGDNAKGGGPWSQFTITKFADPASPVLMKATAAATQYPSIVLRSTSRAGLSSCTRRSRSAT
jgi:type VI protein secretion system component Hcp